MNQQNRIAIDITIQRKNFLWTLIVLPLLFIYFNRFLCEKCVFPVKIECYMLDASYMPAKYQNKAKRSELDIE